MFVCERSRESACVSEIESVFRVSERESVCG